MKKYFVENWITKFEFPGRKEQIPAFLACCAYRKQLALPMLKFRHSLVKVTLLVQKMSVETYFLVSFRFFIRFFPGILLKYVSCSENRFVKAGVGTFDPIRCAFEKKTVEFIEFTSIVVVFPLFISFFFLFALSPSLFANSVHFVH